MHSGHGDQRALQTSPPWHLRLIAAAAVVPTERERAAFVRPVGDGGWFIPCLAAHRTEPCHCWDINPTVSNGRRTHARHFAICQTAARPSTALHRYIVCQKRLERTGVGPKKDPRPVRSNLGSKSIVNQRTQALSSISLLKCTQNSKCLYLLFLCTNENVAVDIGVCIGFLVLGQRIPSRPKQMPYHDDSRTP